MSGGLMMTIIMLTVFSLSSDYRVVVLTNKRAQEIISAWQAIIGPIDVKTFKQKQKERQKTLKRGKNKKTFVNVE